MGEKRRELWPDICRIIMTWGVICIHVSGTWRGYLLPKSLEWWVAAIYGTPWECCVPVFFMLSGMFVLSKETKLSEIFKIKIPKFVSLIVIRRFFNAIVDVIVAALVGELSVNSFINGWNNADDFFLYTLIGFYLICPFLYKICLDKRSEVYFCSMCIIFTMVLPFFIKGKHGDILQNIMKSMNFYFPLGCTVYFITGHIVFKYYLNFINKYKFESVFIAITVIAIRLIDRGLMLEFGASNAFLNISVYPYVSFGTYLYSIAVFLLFAMLIGKIKLSQKVLTYIHHMGKNTVVVYILHLPIKHFFEQINLWPSLGRGIVGIPIEVTIIFLLGYLISLIWEKIPIFRKCIT